MCFLIGVYLVNVGVVSNEPGELPQPGGSALRRSDQPDVVLPHLHPPHQVEAGGEGAGQGEGGGRGAHQVSHRALPAVVQLQHRLFLRCQLNHLHVHHARQKTLL